MLKITLANMIRKNVTKLNYRLSMGCKKLNLKTSLCPTLVIPNNTITQFNKCHRQYHTNINCFKKKSFELADFS